MHPLHGQSVYQHVFQSQRENFMKIEFYRHALGDDEKQSVLKCLDGIFLTSGAYVTEFEKRFSEYLSIPYAVGLNSCTAALHLSLLALGIGKGDEVITTPMTFIATATSILHTGAKPVFADVEYDTGLLDPERVREKITSRTRAILPVHLYGQMCDMKSLRQIADQHGLAIIEDCAHCIEGERENIRPGKLGDAACFSFYATKSITSGEGGAVATHDKELAEKVRLLRQHGMSKEAAHRYHGTYQHWDMMACGWKYNMDNIQASLLLPQLDKIDFMLQNRHQLHMEYADQLSAVPGVQIPRQVGDGRSAHHLFPIWVEEEIRDDLLEKLGHAGIGVAVNYRAIHLLTFFKDLLRHQPGDFPNAENIGNRTISLPFWVGMTKDMVRTVVGMLRKLI
jgi:dTDP-4-amino-4,6-dideoxygalactose transaminase